ncbi:sulfite exporter TauE/SafE family protein [Comamonas aquatica]|uniref:sulfite exporter TauE/SafE family protein n=1 Tax=Comamonas aquatica TaxID=225991 RepID=UPI00244BB9D3|nr:sulfite exporter TauE/SafE family protein [Comamonas aquatica]MDH1379127.1 sulfite exporter TauE/SafE family protein [Comamonas aquatica]MDH1639165.1 sulfite exporter TauE/SafE family protein [Comamonas aquatica]
MIDVAYALAGALTGFVVGLTGVGGGALMTPILLIFFGVSPTTAIATDLWFAAITKLVGARVHHTNGNVDWQVAKRLWLGSLPMALLIVVVVSLGAQVAKVNWLTKAIGIVVLITAIGLLVAPKLVAYARGRRIGQPERFKAVQPALTVVSGGVLGLCVALTSVGAGALGSVMLLYLYPLRMTPHRLVATDIVHAIPLAVVAGLGYLFAGMVDWWMLASLLVGSVPTVLLGSLLAGKIPGRAVQIALALVLMAAGVKVLV